MIYAKLYRTGEPSEYWAFRFFSKKIFRNAVKRLNKVKESRVCRHKYKWYWKRWRLERLVLSRENKELRPFIKESSGCENAEDVLLFIERLHGFWDDHIS